MCRKLRYRIVELWIRDWKQPGLVFVEKQTETEILKFVRVAESHANKRSRGFEILGEGLRFPSRTLDLIVKFQNGNGGFRRSIFLGISTFESTYYAISACLAIVARSE